MNEAARWRTGTLLAALFAATLLLPPAVFTLAAAAAFCIAAWEWGGLSSLQRRGRLLCVLAAAAAAALLPPAGATGAMILSAAAVFWWCAALVWVAHWPRGAELWNRRAACCLAGALTLTPAFAALLALRNESALALAFLAVLTALTDIGAWFAGRRWGRTPLLPAVSPGKTRAGFWGGTLCALALIVCAALFAPQGPRLALAGAAAALAAPLGDLLESMFKRRAGVKDSGALLPGHGGMLDRIDGLCAAAPVFFVCWRLQ